jgi:hypothetical protein
MEESKDDRREPATAESPEEDGGDAVTIYIDRNAFLVAQRALTGTVLRQLPTPPIRGDFDLFRVAPGAEEDLLVHDDEVIELEDGARFFTAPQRILAG